MCSTDHCNSVFFGVQVSAPEAVLCEGVPLSNSFALACMLVCTGVLSTVRPKSREHGKVGITVNDVGNDEIVVRPVRPCSNARGSAPLPSFESWITFISVITL